MVSIRDSSSRHARMVFSCWWMALLGLGVSVLASDFWDTKPWTEWNKKHVERILNNSPWVRNVYQSRADPGGAPPTPGTKPDLGSAPRECIRVRFRTARPIRLALARLAMLQNPDSAIDSDQVARQYLAEWPDQIVIDFQPDADVGTRSRQWMLDLDRRLRFLTTEHLKRKAYLISPRLGMIELVDYLPPSSDGTGAKIVFPRSVNGEPVVSPGDREIAFKGLGVYVTWKVKKLFFQGELAY